MKNFGWFLAIVLSLMYSDEIIRDINYAMKEFNVDDLSLRFSDGDMSKKSCDDLVDLLTGKSIKNEFGGEFKIVKIRNAQQVSKTVNQIVCEGTVLLDTGKKTLLDMTMYSEDGQIYYEAKALN